MRSPRGLIATVVTVVALSLSGCGSDDSTPTATPTTDDSTAPPTPSEASTPAAGGQVIDVTITADKVTPNGERVEVEKGQDVTLVVTATEAGEIHVHSTPEQELEYDAGTTTLTITGIDQPGVVDVESHNLEKVIVQLEVS